tara:strand:+ start:390 stop:731 length:342 start_codon:yes stop_codon:yes gene_type:complete
MTIKLKPACFEGFPLAITNQGVLLPCCYCDDPHTTTDKEFKKLMAVSKLDDYDSIEQILATKQWKRFYKNLRRHVGPPACMTICSIKKGKGKGVRRDEHVTTSNKKLKQVREI